MKILIGFVLSMAMMTPTNNAQASDTPVLSKGQLEQVALTVSNLDAARRFYKDKLGLPLLFEANNMLFFDVDGVRLMIAYDAARQRQVRTSSILYFHVDGFEDALSRLRSSHAKLVGPVETVQSTSAGSLKLQQFEDADGNMLAIMGMVSN